MHQLLDMDITALNPNELRAFIERLDAVKHAPAARRAIVKKEAAAIKKGKSHETIDQVLAHIL